MTGSFQPAVRIDNPHNRVIAYGAPTRIRMADGRIYCASWNRPQWRDVVAHRWIDALPADAAAALRQAQDEATDAR
jgi:hypothetical protein